MKVFVQRNEVFQEFEVPREPSQTVLDVVTYIQRRLDPTLAYMTGRLKVEGSMGVALKLTSMFAD